jgi:hypothetical protein
MRLIGIAGKAGSGKDTVADYLKKHHNFESVAYADPIRAGMRAIFGLRDVHFQHPCKEIVIAEYGKSPRQMMQTLGTDWARNLVNNDLWLILAGKRISALHEQHINVVVTDVRFENEANYIRKQGGEVWHISRSAAGTPHTHASEAGIAFNGVSDSALDNNGTLLELYTQVEAAL